MNTKLDAALPQGKPLCPLCGEAVDELLWEAEIVKAGGKIIYGCFVPPEPWEEQRISIPPGHTTLKPCGHSFRNTPQEILKTHGKSAG